MKTTLKMSITAAALIAAGALGTSAFAHSKGGGHGGGYGGDNRGGYHGAGHRGDCHRGRRHHARTGPGMGPRAHLMERYDANNDKKVTQEEINTNREAWHKDFDANDDGILSLDEFMQLWLKARAEVIVREFQRFDRDGDAALTQEEYLRPMVEIVEMHDRDGDGALSREDRRRHHKHHGRMRHDDGRDDADEAPETESKD